MESSLDTALFSPDHITFSFSHIHCAVNKMQRIPKFPRPCLTVFQENSQQTMNQAGLNKLEGPVERQSLSPLPSNLLEM